MKVKTRNYLLTLAGIFILLAVSAVVILKNGMFSVGSGTANESETAAEIGAPAGANGPNKKLDDPCGYAILRGTLYVTTDYGSSWYPVPVEDLTTFAGSDTSGHPYENELSAASCFITPDKAAFVGFSADGKGLTVLFSDNGGQTWTQQNLETRGTNPCITFTPDPNIGYVAIQINTAMSQADVHLFKTTDGGQTWAQSPSPSYETPTWYLNGISFSSENVGFLTWELEHTPLMTTDGGQTWTSCVLTCPDEYNAYDHFFPPVFNGSHGELLANQGGPADKKNEEMAQWISEDGGLSWVFDGIKEP